MKNNYGLLALLGGVLGFALPRLFHLPIKVTLSAIAALAISLAIGWPLGALVGHVLSKDGEVDATAYRVVAWTNLIFWLIPAIGVTISVITYQFSRQSASFRRQYFFLGLIGGLLAFANALVGGALEASRPNKHIVQVGQPAPNSRLVATRGTP